MKIQTVPRVRTLLASYSWDILVFCPLETTVGYALRTLFNPLLEENGSLNGSLTKNTSLARFFHIGSYTFQDPSTSDRVERLR